MILHTQNRQLRLPAQYTPLQPQELYEADGGAFSVHAFVAAVRSAITGVLGTFGVTVTIAWDGRSLADEVDDVLPTVASRLRRIRFSHKVRVV